MDTLRWLRGDWQVCSCGFGFNPVAGARVGGGWGNKLFRGSETEAGHFEQVFGAAAHKVGWLKV